MFPPGCDYAEQRDNDELRLSPATGTPEASGLMLATMRRSRGMFDSTHYDGDITSTSTGTRSRFHGSGMSSCGSRARAPRRSSWLGVDVYGNVPAFDAHRALGYVLRRSRRHGGAPAGTYELEPFALSSQAITLMSVAYKLDIEEGQPRTRIAGGADDGGYAESHDGALNNGNDMIAFPSGSPATLQRRPPTWRAEHDVAVPDRDQAPLRAAPPTSRPPIATKIAMCSRSTPSKSTSSTSTVMDWHGKPTSSCSRPATPKLVIQATDTTGVHETATAALKRKRRTWFVVGAKGTRAPLRRIRDRMRGLVPL